MPHTGKRSKGRQRLCLWFNWCCINARSWLCWVDLSKGPPTLRETGNLTNDRRQWNGDPLFASKQCHALLMKAEKAKSTNHLLTSALQLLPSTKKLSDKAGHHYWKDEERRKILSEPLMTFISSGRSGGGGVGPEHLLACHSSYSTKQCNHRLALIGSKQMHRRIPLLLKTMMACQTNWVLAVPLFTKHVSIDPFLDFME